LHNYLSINKYLDKKYFNNNNNRFALLLFLEVIPNIIYFE